MSDVILAIVEGLDAGQEFPLTGTMLIGRDPDADVVVADTEVVDEARLFCAGRRRRRLEDHGSTNGTFVNGRRVTGSQQLQAGDRISWATR